MIGVLPRPGQGALVEEFFQLFKTPWELWRPGRTYDVVVATADEIPETGARLCVVYGAGPKSVDGSCVIGSGLRHAGGPVEYRGYRVPIYRDLLTFAPVPGDRIASAGRHAAGFRVRLPETTVIRLGYDLFDELDVLLSAGQPPGEADTPALDIHIMMLRDAMLAEGITFIEIPPIPAGSPFCVCLTHDIDFVGIRQHKLDHTMWGFVHRSTFGAVGSFFRRRLRARRLLKIWRALITLPFVYLGWAKDFWDPFGWYLSVERGLPATYFLIPFKRRSGDRVPAPKPERRGTAYDVTDIPQWTAALMDAGCELGVHGIDAWSDPVKGKAELDRITRVTGASSAGVRMHWLIRDADTPRVLEEAGYTYDSTAGYNETIGYRNGTTQVHRTPGARSLLELPLHIQDGALFFPQRLALSESEAWQRCMLLVEHAKRLGGVLTVLWHDRSHGPERFWGEFYEKLVDVLRSCGVWFGTGGQVVAWFQKRRDVHFEELHENGSMRLRLHYHGPEITPALTVRIQRASMVRDQSWNGESPLELPVDIGAAAVLCP